MRESILADFDHEMAATRQVLERVPEPSFAWKPHDKSFSLGGLATHLARLPHWGSHILNHDAYDLATAGSRAPEETTLVAVLALFDRHVTEVRQRLVTLADAELDAPWALKRGGQSLFTMPRILALRRFVVHHAIHHRGQMTVYLRLQGVPLPPLYGPTADEVM